MLRQRRSAEAECRGKGRGLRQRRRVEADNRGTGRGLRQTTKAKAEGGGRQQRQRQRAEADKDGETTLALTEKQWGTAAENRAMVSRRGPWSGFVL